MTRTDPRLKIITEALRRLIPRSVPANVTVRLEEGLPGYAGCNSWDGDLSSLATHLYTALYGRPAEHASPLQQAEDAKRRRDLVGEVDALMDGLHALESAPWYPTRSGDIVHVAYDALPPHLPAHGETYIVVEHKNKDWFDLRLLAHTHPPLMIPAGNFATEASLDPLLDMWFEAGPHRLTIVRDGRVIHPRAT